MFLETANLALIRLRGVLHLPTWLLGLPDAVVLFEQAHLLFAGGQLRLI